MHVLLATTLKIKHLKNVQTSPSPESMNDVEQTDEYKAFMVSYERFCDETRDGKHGVNAKKIS